MTFLTLLFSIPHPEFSIKKIANKMLTKNFLTFIPNTPFTNIFYFYTYYYKYIKSVQYSQYEVFIPFFSFIADITIKRIPYSD